MKIEIFLNCWWIWLTDQVACTRCSWFSWVFNATTQRHISSMNQAQNRTCMFSKSHQWTPAILWKYVSTELFCESNVKAIQAKMCKRHFFFKILLCALYCINIVLAKQPTGALSVYSVEIYGLYKAGMYLRPGKKHVWLGNHSLSTGQHQGSNLGYSSGKQALYNLSLLDH